MLNQCVDLARFIFTQDHVWYFYEDDTSKPTVDHYQIVSTIDVDKKCHLMDMPQLLNSVFDRNHQPFTSHGPYKKKLTFNDKNEYNKNSILRFMPELIIKFEMLFKQCKKKRIKEDLKCSYSKFHVYSLFNDFFYAFQHVLVHISKLDFFESVSNSKNEQGTPIIEMDTFRCKFEMKVE